MKCNKTRVIIYKAFFLVVLIVLVNLSVFGQGPGPCDPFSDPNCESGGGDPYEPVPIDGGASVLIAAGVAYGLKKVYDKRKQNKAEDIV